MQKRVRPRGLRFAFAILVAIALLLLRDNVALATHGFHNYAIMQDKNQFAYTGVYSTRTDQVPTGLNPGPCPAIPYQNNPVYYTQWVIIKDSPLEWVELGSGYGCVGQRYWFWGYGANGNWNSLGAEWNFPLQQNYYDIHRLAEFWFFDINGQNMGTKFWNAVGIRVEAGLESYNGHIDVPWTTHWQLQKTLSESPWYYWTNSVAPPPGSLMCGQKLSDTSFRDRQRSGPTC